MRTLVRFGPCYAMEGRTVHRVGPTEVLETVTVRTSLWRERGASQRWVSLEVTTGSHAGLEVFVPLEAMEGEGLEVSPALSSALLE